MIIDHSIVGSAEGAYSHFKNSSSLESHFIVKKDGEVWQLIDTDRTADANYRANPFAISIETEDDGDPDRDPWTPAQLESLVRLHDWIAETHGVPRRRCPSWDEGGLGFHTLFGAPSQWTPVAKTCPGRARIKQWHEVLLPAFESGAAGIEEGFVVIREGDKNEAVEYWQDRANFAVDRRHRVKVDGEFGPATAKLFQRALGKDEPVTFLGGQRQSRVEQAALVAALRRVAGRRSKVDVDRLAAEVAENLDVVVTASVKPKE